MFRSLILREMGLKINKHLIESPDEMRAVMKRGRAPARWACRGPHGGSERPPSGGDICTGESHATIRWKAAPGRGRSRGPQYHQPESGTCLGSLGACKGGQVRGTAGAEGGRRAGGSQGPEHGHLPRQARGQEFQGGFQGISSALL